MFDGLFSSAVPLIFMSTGAVISELGGCLAIFIEGFTNLGAFFTFFLMEKTNSAFISCAIVFSICGITGLLTSRFVRALKSDPFITALAVNIFSNGFTVILSESIYSAKGTLRSDAVAPLISLDIPLIKNVPFIGSVLSPLSPFALFACFSLPLLFFILNYTRQGHSFKASGLNPEAARECGLRPETYRDVSWALAAAFAGLAGAALVFRIGVYAPGNGGNLGWIALAVVYLGQKNIFGVTLSAVLFTAAERVAFGAQGIHITSATALLGLAPFLALIFYSLSCFNKKRQKSRLN